MRRVFLLLGLAASVACADEPIEPEEPPLQVEHPPPKRAGGGGVAGGELSPLGPETEVLPCEGAVPWSEGLEHEVFPTFPTGARGASGGPWTCSLCVDVDARGRPETVTVSGCPTVFEAPSREAVAQFRWRPRRVDGRPEPFRTAVNLKYRLVD